MSSLTDRTSYLRGLAEGMGLDKQKNENRLLLEMLDVMNEMAQKVQEVQGNVEDLDEYIESIDDDLADMEDALFGDEPDEDGCDCEDCEGLDADDEDEPLAFECPHCGKSLQIKASDIDFDQSPTCPSCHKPFFPDVIEGEDGDDDQ